MNFCALVHQCQRMKITHFISFNRIGTTFELQIFKQPQCNKPIISNTEKAEGKFDSFEESEQMEYKKRLFVKQSISKFIGPFSVEGARAQQQPHYLRREKSASQSFSNSEFSTSRTVCQISAKASESLKS